jgi:hypothetical protein
MLSPPRPASRWRVELTRQIQVSLPAKELGTDPQAAVQQVSQLTDRWLAGEFEAV